MGGRKLEEHRAKLWTEVLRPFPEELNLAADILKSPYMGDVTAGFHGKLEAFRRGLAPALKHVGGGEAIKRIVQLDGGKAAGIVSQFFADLEACRIEDPLPPMPIHVP